MEFWVVNKSTGKYELESVTTVAVFDNEQDAQAYEQAKDDSASEDTSYMVWGPFTLNNDHDD